MVLCMSTRVILNNLVTRDIKLQIVYCWQQYCLYTPTYKKNIGLLVNYNQLTIDNMPTCERPVSSTDDETFSVFFQWEKVESLVILKIVLQ